MCVREELPLEFHCNRCKHTSQLLFSLLAAKHNTTLETGDYRSKAKLALRCCLNPMFNDLYLRCVCGCDDPSAVSIVVVLDRVVWRCDDTSGSSQLTSTHWCYKGKTQREANVWSMAG